MTKLSLKINRKYKKFSCNQHYCLVPVIGLTGLLIRRPKRFRAWLWVLRLEPAVPSPLGGGRSAAREALKPVLGARQERLQSQGPAGARQGLGCSERAGLSVAAAPLPCQAIHKSYRSMPGLIFIQGYQEHAAPRVIFPSFFIPFKFNMKDSQVAPTQEETRFPCF